MTNVLDACALIAYFRAESGGQRVQNILFDEESHNYIHTLNLCEVYYDFLRFAGEDAANQVLTDCESYGIQFREDADSGIWKFAGQLKAEYKRLSLADCFALALAKRLNATLVTSDHGEFDKMVEKNICPILFIR